MGWYIVPEIGDLSDPPPPLGCTCGFPANVGELAALRLAFLTPIKTPYYRGGLW